MAVYAPGDTPQPYAPSPLPGVAPTPGAALPIAQTAAPTGAYHPSEINAALIQAGIPPHVAPILTAVSGAESGFGKSIASGVNKNGTRDWGVFQVNDGAHPQYGGPAIAKQPLAVQAKAAAEIYNKEGLGAWSTYKNGAYKSFLGKDFANVATTGAPPAPTGAPAATTQPTLAEAMRSGNVGAMLAALTKTDEKTGKSPLSSFGDQLQPKPQQAQPQSGGGMAMPAPMPDLANPAQELLAQTIQMANKPLTWAAGPYGSGAGQVPGTTLNS